MEVFKGYLLVSENNGIVKYAFKYAEKKSRNYKDITTGSGFNFIEPTQTIQTSRNDLPFAKGSKVELADGAIMTVADIDKVINPYKATFDGVGLDGYVIYLKGGG